MTKRIAMIVFSYYPADPRPRREAEALVDKGILVDVICLRNNFEPKQEIVNDVHVYRMPLRRKRGRQLYYLWKYTFFIMMSLFILSILYVRKRYNIIHIHNMPDILVLSALVPRLYRSKIILDLHDPMPEVFMAKYSFKETHAVIKLLRLQEKFSIWFSDLVLTPNIAFRDIFISRGCPKSKIHIVMNSPQESIFKMKHSSSNNDKFVIMYHGTIVERNGLGVALEGIALLKQRIPKITFQVYGEGDFLNQFKKIVVELDLEDIVDYCGYIPLDKIPLAIQNCNLGIIPNKPSIHWQHAMPTRIFEYLCLRKPVVAPRTRGILDYFNEKSIYFFEPGNAESLANVILRAYKNPNQVQAVLERGVAVYHRHRWELQKHHFVTLVKDLL